MRPLALIPLVVSLLVACGGDDAVHSSGEVVDLFEERTGERLAVELADDAHPWERLGLAGTSGEDGSLNEEGLRLAEVFGAFTIYVIDEGESYDAVYESLVDEDDTEASDETVEGSDERGVLWVRTCYRGELAGVPCAYSAWKRYGENVVLRWEGGEERRARPTLARLDAVLSALEEG